MSLTERIRAGRQPAPATFPAPVEPLTSVIVLVESPHSHGAVRRQLPARWLTALEGGAYPRT